MNDERRPPSPSDSWPPRLREGTGTAADLLRRYDKQSLATPPAGAAWERTVVGLGRASRAAPWKFGAAVLAGACATALIVALGPWPVGHQVKVAARLERVPTGVPAHESSSVAATRDIATAPAPRAPLAPPPAVASDRRATVDSVVETLHEGPTFLRPGTRVRLQRGSRALLRSPRFDAIGARRSLEIVLDHGLLALENESRAATADLGGGPGRDGQPLIVIVAPYRLVVLGAAFRVSRSGGRVGIVVQEGHVQVSRDDDALAVADLGRGARWSGPTLFAKTESQKRRGISKTGEKRAVVASLFAKGASPGAVPGAPGIEKAPALALAARPSASPATVPVAPAPSSVAALVAPAAPTPADLAAATDSAAATLAAPPSRALSAPGALPATASSAAPPVAPAAPVAPAVVAAPSAARRGPSASASPELACPSDAPGETRFRCWWSRGQGSGLSAEAALFEAATTASRGLRDPARAVTTLRALLARFPHGALRAEAHAALAEALPELGRYEEARAEATEALAAGIAPGTSQAAGLHLLRARAAAHQGDCTAAAVDYRQAATDPHLARVARDEAPLCTAKPEHRFVPVAPEDRP